MFSTSQYYPKLSSPQSDKRPASIKFPKNFQPVGTSKISFPSFAATLNYFLLICKKYINRDIRKFYLSTAAPVGILLANPLTPFTLK